MADGATLVGVAFVLPSFVIVLALGWAYTLYGGLTWMQAAFYGIGASVIAIIAISAYRLTLKTIHRDWLLRSNFLVSAVMTVITESEFILLFLLAGLVNWLAKTGPRLPQGVLRDRTATRLPKSAKSVHRLRPCRHTACRRLVNVLHEKVLVFLSCFAREC